MKNAIIGLLTLLVACKSPMSISPEIQMPTFSIVRDTVVRQVVSVRRDTQRIYLPGQEVVVTDTVTVECPPGLPDTVLSVSVRHVRAKCPPDTLLIYSVHHDTVRIAPPANPVSLPTGTGGIPWHWSVLFCIIALVVGWAGKRKAASPLAVSALLLIACQEGSAQDNYDWAFVTTKGIRVATLAGVSDTTTADITYIWKKNGSSVKRTPPDSIASEIVYDTTYIGKLQVDGHDVFIYTAFGGNTEIMAAPSFPTVRIQYENSIFTYY